MEYKDDDFMDFGLEEIESDDNLPRPDSIEALDVPKELITNGIVRHLYFSGNQSGLELSQRMKIPYNNIVEPLLEHLVKQKLLFFEGGRGFGRSSMDFNLTEEGRRFAQDNLQKDRYLGPMPVSLKQYKKVFENSKQIHPLSLKELKDILQELVLPEELFYKLGPAINSNHSIFLYGPPGNGKTVVAEKVGKKLKGELIIPYALEINGQVIKIYDEYFHEVIEEHPLDPRWLRIKRPYVFVGGELTYNMLNLNIDPISMVYEAPLQLKANGGIFLIDDFGRQKEDPSLFLNRWIVPLESGFDVLNLSSGKSFTIPFEQLIIFSTNLDPKDLVDDAFLRRIRYKIGMHVPSPEIFLQIFEKTAQAYNIDYQLSDIENFFFYNQNKVPRIKSVLPRDMCRVIKDICKFEGFYAEVNFYTLKRASEIAFIQAYKGSRDISDSIIESQ